MGEACCLLRKAARGAHAACRRWRSRGGRSGSWPWIGRSLSTGRLEPDSAVSVDRGMVTPPTHIATHSVQLAWEQECPRLPGSSGGDTLPVDTRVAEVRQARKDESRLLPHKRCLATACLQLIVEQRLSCVQDRGEVTPHTDFGTTLWSPLVCVCALWCCSAQWTDALWPSPA